MEKKLIPSIRCFAALLLAGLVSVWLTACSGSSSSPSPQPQSTNLTGVFVDSAVHNIGYRTETREGVTNGDGEFQYLKDESVTFFIGDLELPPVKAKDLVTPLDIAGTDNINNPVVVNIARLLQSLDVDGDSSNGITIPNQAALIATQVDFSLSVEAFAVSVAVQTLVANSGSVNVNLVSVEDALAHLRAAIGISDKGLVGAWHVTRDESSVIFVFFANGTYVHVEDGTNDPNGQDGMERGTYTWNAITGDFTSTCPSVDTNGQWGLSNRHPVLGCIDTHAQVTVTGDSLEIILEDDQVTLARVAGATDDIVGAWHVTRDESSVIFVFFANGTYVHVEDGTNDPNGQDGMERGTYTWNAITGDFASTCPSVDTNGQWGLSHQHPELGCTGTLATVTVTGDSLEIILEDDQVTLARVIP